MGGESYNAADERRVKDAAKKNSNERETELNDIKDILSRPSGMRFFKRMLADGHMFSSTFTGNSQSFFLEGHRNFMLKYFGDVCEACPEKVAALVIIQKPDEEKK